MQQGKFGVSSLKIITAACLLASLLSCNSLEEAITEQQEKNIENYIISRMRSDTVLRRSQFDGVHYLYRPGDTTKNRLAGDTIVVDYFGRLLVSGSDTVMFDTNIEYFARRMGIDIAGRSFEPLTVVAGTDRLLSGLNKGLMLTHPKDTGEIIFNSDFGFGNKSNGRVPGNSPLIYTVYVFR